ncbi:MAG: MMPL family transporter [Planctomycetota bacterium]
MRIFPQAQKPMMAEPAVSNEAAVNEEQLARGYRKRGIIGVALMALLAGPLILGSDFAIESLFNRPNEWVPTSLPERVAFDEFASQFPAADIILVSWPGCILEDESLQASSDLLSQLVDAEDDSEEINEANEVQEAIGKEEVPNETEEDSSSAFIARLWEACHGEAPLVAVTSGTEIIDRMTSGSARIGRKSSIRRLEGTLVGEDGESTCLVISLSEAGLIARRTVIPEIRQKIAEIAGLSSSDIVLIGNPFDGTVVDDESIRSINRYSPPSAIVAAVLCFLFLRSIYMTGAVVIVAVLGQGLVLSAVYASGIPMNAVLIVLPPLVFVLTVSSGIHLSNYFLDIHREFPGLPAAIAAQQAMKAGVLPCCLATGTTVVGLLSLLLVRLEPVRIFGGVASLGVSATLAMLILVLPAAMLLSARREPSAQDPEAAQDPEPEGAHNTALWNFVRKRLTRPWLIIIIFIGSALVLSTGLGQLRSSVNVPRMFLPDSDIRRNYDWFSEHIGPTTMGELVLDFQKNNSLEDPLPSPSERRRAALAVQKSVLERPEVGAVLSVLNFIPPIRKGFSIRGNIIDQLINDPESAVRDLNYIADTPEVQRWRMSIRMHQDEDADIGQAIERIRATAERALSETEVEASIVMTGSVVIVHRSQEILLRDLFRSFVTAFGFIAIVMILMLRSIVGGLVAMLPNLFPTVALFGVMGLIKMPLDIGSVMSASVALGIAVDDNVHLLSRFGARRARGLGQIRSAVGAVQQCGGAMIQTTVVCGLALMAYWFSDFVPTSRFSLLMFSLLSTALFCAVVFMPALMASRLGRWLARPMGCEDSATVTKD